MPHEDDLPYVASLPNGWVMLEPGEIIPTERMYNYRDGDGWDVTVDTPSYGIQYDPDQHRALARRISASEVEW